VSSITLSADRLDNTNQIYPVALQAFTDLQPQRVDNTSIFYAAAMAGGSPVPIPFHPQCQRGSMAVIEFARGNMVVAELPRASMTVTELPRSPMTNPGC